MRSDKSCQSFCIYRPIFIFLEVSQDIVVLVVFHDAKHGARVKVFQNRFVVVDHRHLRTTATGNDKNKNKHKSATHLEMVLKITAAILND